MSPYFITIKKYKLKKLKFLLGTIKVGCIAWTKSKKCFAFPHVLYLRSKVSELNFAIKIFVFFLNLLN